MKNWRLILATIIVFIVGWQLLFTPIVPIKDNNVLKPLVSVEKISNLSMIELVNTARDKEGLYPLKENELLNISAKNKACHMLNEGYFAHISPDGVTPWTFFYQVGYKYSYAEENLSSGYISSASAMKAWMESVTHRDNILNDRVTEIGIGSCGDFMVQHFGVK